MRSAVCTDSATHLLSAQGLHPVAQGLHSAAQSIHTMLLLLPLLLLLISLYIKRTGLVQETKLNAFRPLGWKSEATPNMLIMLSAQTFKHNLTTYM